jgi:hypothetical protein
MAVAVGERYTDITLKRHGAEPRPIRGCDLFTPLPANQFELRILAAALPDLSRLTLPRHVEIWQGSRLLCVLKGVALVCRSRKRWVGRVDAMIGGPDLTAPKTPHARTAAPEAPGRR